MITTGFTTQLYNHFDYKNEWVSGLYDLSEEWNTYKAYGLYDTEDKSVDDTEDLKIVKVKIESEYLIPKAEYNRIFELLLDQKINSKNERK